MCPISASFAELQLNSTSFLQTKGLVWPVYLSGQGMKIRVFSLTYYVSVLWDW